uniref:TPR_REGION domain-containing protein n=1 Tax=Ascaris lumbricoides TaxID=6252 RepID=A0A0M3HYY2_ASCLU
MEQERQEGQLDDGETLGDFGAAIPLVITRGHRRGLGYITRDPPGFMLLFLFKGPTSVTMRDEESGVRCTYVCRECQLLRSSDRTLPMAPFVFVVSGRFITNPESSPFWEHYCKLRPTGEVFAEGALNELRRATTMDTSDASRREAVARCIASTEARTDISDIEKADMWRRMLTSLRAKKGYRSACALLRAALSKNPAVSYLRSSAGTFLLFMQILRAEIVAVKFLVPVSPVTDNESA